MEPPFPHEIVEVTEKDGFCRGWLDLLRLLRGFRYRGGHD
jgi:hypothetical protein